MSVCTATFVSLDAYRAATADTRRVLIARVPSGTSSGISDHVTGIVSAFALAIATRRAFRIDWPVARAAFRPRFDGLFLSDAERDQLSARLDVELTVRLDASEKMTSARTCEPNKDGSAMICQEPLALFDWLPGRVPQTVDEDLVLRNTRLNGTFSGATTVVQWRRGVLDRALRVDDYYPLGRALTSLDGVTRRTAFACFYRYLFKAPRLSGSMAAAHRRIESPASHRVVLGVHVRTGDEGQTIASGEDAGPAGGGLVSQSVSSSGSSAEPNADAAASGSDSLAVEAWAPATLESPLYQGYTGSTTSVPNSAMLDCAAQLEAAMRTAAEERGTTSGDALWVVASDSKALRQQLHEAKHGHAREGRALLPLDGEAAIHSASWTHWKLRHGLRVTAQEDPARLAEVRAYEAAHRRLLLLAGVEALHEQWVLGAAPSHVVGAYTGFGRIAHAISLSHTPRQESRLYLVHPTTGECTRWSFDELVARPPFL